MEESLIVWMNYFEYFVDFWNRSRAIEAFTMINKGLMLFFFKLR